MVRNNGERVFVREGDQIPFATVVLFKENATTFHAWQLEYDIEVTAATMERAIALVADQMGEKITDPKYDYLSKKHRGFFIPYTMSADDFAQSPEGLSDIMSEIFETEAPADVSAYIFVCVLPNISQRPATSSV